MYIYIYIYIYIHMTNNANDILFSRCSFLHIFPKERAMKSYQFVSKLWETVTFSNHVSFYTGQHYGPDSCTTLRLNLRGLIAKLYHPANEQLQYKND